jgi:hypothetical protein
MRPFLAFVATFASILLNSQAAAQFGYPFLTVDLAATIHMGAASPLVSNHTDDFGLPRRHSAGGTFDARDDSLNSFTMYIRQNGYPASKFRFIVMGTDESGVPMLPLLWESPDQTVPPISQDYVPFTLLPNLPIQPGHKYYLGIDTGKFTTVQSEAVGFGISAVNSIPEGNFWQTLFFVPEPSTSMLTLALLALPFTLRRRR